jgi:lipid-binding SYLF domain-containing protein
MKSRIEVTTVKRITTILVGIVLPIVFASLTIAASSDYRDDVARIDHAAHDFRSIMGTPDKAIPHDLVHSAQCIAIIPGEKTAAFFVGGKYGKGVVSCRTQHGWSAPAFISVGGGSYGFQWGVASTDVVMVFENHEGLAKLLSSKFRVGVDATAAAGPIGRHVAAATNITMHSEILTYARSRGVFAGVSLNGAVVQPDESGDAAMYGANARTQQILAGETKVPKAAHPLLTTLDHFSGLGPERVARNRSH